MKKELLSLAVLTMPVLSHAEFNPIERISTSPGGSQGNASSFTPSISSDTSGRYVAFSSSATNFTSSDNNNATDIFLRDTLLGTTTLVSHALAGGVGSSTSNFPRISGDGAFVVFQSSANNLVSSDDNGFADIFLYDRVMNTNQLISNGIADDAGGSAANPAISNDGLFVVFDSSSLNLVASDTNGFTDIFLYDVTGDSITLISRASGGGNSDGSSTNPAISGDGRFIVFQSSAENLNGGDNGLIDIFLHDTTTNTTQLITKDTGGSLSNGTSTNPVISIDGKIIAFQSTATDLAAGDQDSGTDVFVYNTVSAMIEPISQSSTGNRGNGVSQTPSLSTDGRFVAFESAATNLAGVTDSNDVTDIFVRDRIAGTTVRASVSESGIQPNNSSASPALNGNAHFLAFASDATNLIADSNESMDIFVIDQQCTVAPPGVVPANQDGDAANDCSDDCPLDPAKIAEGACGCGVADTDSDGDGSADCEDQCDTDPGKSTPGDCGCGVLDVDANGNGQSDCLDVTPATVPPAPKVSVTKRKTLHGRRVNQNLIRVIAPEGFVVDQYRFYISRNGNVVAQKSRSIRSARFSISKRGLNQKRYGAFYDLAVPGTALFTQRSPARKFTLE